MIHTQRTLQAHRVQHQGSCRRVPIGPAAAHTAGAACQTISGPAQPVRGPRQARALGRAASARALPEDAGRNALEATQHVSAQGCALRPPAPAAALSSAPGSSGACSCSPAAPSSAALRRAGARSRRPGERTAGAARDRRGMAGLRSRSMAQVSRADACRGLPIERASASASSTFRRTPWLHL